MGFKSYTEELLFRWLPVNVNSGLMDLKTLLDNMCVDYIQPETGTTGGITEAKRISVMPIRIT